VNRKLKILLAAILLGYGALLFIASDFYQSTQHRDIITPDLPLKFAHIDHAEEKCAECHHNYQDNTGHGLCLDCHFRDPELSFLMEQQFHDLCRGCHEEKHLQGEDSGPLRICGDCHQEDFLP